MLLRLLKKLIRLKNLLNQVYLASYVLWACFVLFYFGLFAP